MTPADLERRVAVALAALRYRVPDCPAVPAAWTRHVQSVVLRNALLRVHPEDEQATVLWAVIGRLGLVVDG